MLGHRHRWRPSRSTAPNVLRVPPATTGDPKPAGRLVVLAWQIEKLAAPMAPAQVVESANEGV
jgi:hypothetical protein